MRLWFVLPLIGLLLVPRSTFGQAGQNGSISGYVTDQNGMPLKGVRVNATSPTQIGGAKIGYTNDDGFFRLPGLDPGVFEVRASAPKLKTVLQRGIAVGINAPAEVNVVMEVETAVEEVRVIEKSPVISTTTANVKETYDLDFVESIPLDSRDAAHRQVVNLAPGARDRRMRGGAINQTLFTQDGFDMRDVFPTQKTSAAFEVQTAGYGADAPIAPGGVVNMVTRSGSNRWEAEFNATTELRQLEFFRSANDPALGRERHVLNPMLAGPIVKDRLWFYFNFESHIQTDGVEKDPLGVAPDPPVFEKYINKGTLKLTWQVSPRNKLSSLTTFDSAYEVNRLMDVGITREAQQERITGRVFQGLTWESLLGDSLFFRTQVGYNQYPEHIYPSLCKEMPVDCEHIPAVLQTVPRSLTYGNATEHQRVDLYSMQFGNRLDWYLNGGVLGEHSISLRDQFFGQERTNWISHPGDKLTQYIGSTPDRETIYYSNDARFEAPRSGWYITRGTFWRHVTTLSDSWKPTRRLTLIPSLSHVYATGENGQGDRPVTINTFAPSVALAWDATHDGRTVFRGSVSKYVDADLQNVVEHTNGIQPQRMCRYNTATGEFDRNCVYSGGRSTNTFGTPCGPTGIDADGRDCRESLKAPRTWEYSGGVERELFPGTAVGVDVVYRRFSNQFETRETNKIWAGSGDTVLDYRNGRRENVTDLGTPDDAKRRYIGVTGSLARREGPLKVQGTYTWARLDGTVFDGLKNDYGDIPPQDVYLFGALPEDRRHEIKLTATYQITKWMSGGMRYMYLSGAPYRRLFYNDETGNFDSYRAEVGIDPGVNLNDPGDDRALRTPDRQSLNLQLRFAIKPGIGRRLDLYVEALNVLGLRTETAFGQQDGRDFGVPTTRMEPFRIRLGLNYRY